MRRRSINARRRILPILSPALFIIAIQLFVALVAPARQAIGQSAGLGWSYTGSLNVRRYGHTATLLPDGKVVVAGGYSTVDKLPLDSAELYNPATGTWSNTGSLKGPHSFHTATLLANGKVLVVGGWAGSAGPAPTNSAELYDPATRTWSLTGNLNVPRLSHTATLLPNGKILVAGGWTKLDDGTTTVTNSAELYDPGTATWNVTGSLNTARDGHSATLLPNGKVLVAAGSNEDDFCPGLDSSELYDPSTGTWSVTGSLNSNRWSYTATLLPNGKVLAAGGLGGCVPQTTYETAELYDPVTGTWSYTGKLNTARGEHTATLLPNRQVLVAGGYGNGLLLSAELYDPATGNWNSTTSLNAPQSQHTATLLQNGKVLIVGGLGAGNISQGTAQLYDSGATSFANPIDESRFFVRQQYLDFLNREPDADGLAFWTNQIISCGADPQCIEVKRINDSGAFFLSIEFQESGYLVYRFYKTAFGNLANAPVAVRFSEFLPDAQQIGKDVIVNQPGWQTVLENNQQEFGNAFVQRPQFMSTFPTTMSPDAFVDMLFANAGVTPASADRTAAINEFEAAIDTSDGGARARVLRRVAENSTLAHQEFNRAFVLMQYFGYLRRNPSDAPDGNFDGYNFWLNKLNQFSGDSNQAEMVRAFIESTEYRQRFGPQ